MINNSCLQITFGILRFLFQLKKLKQIGIPKN